MEVRLLSGSGAAFALIAVPDLSRAVDDGVRLMDVELLSPDRLVRYLNRPVPRRFFEQLAEAWMSCAQDAHPEQSVATVEDVEAGLAFAVTASTPFTVAIEVIIVPDLEDDVVEHDGLDIEVARASLIGAAHTLHDWLA
ncbi:MULTISPECIES: hypothetical protein [Mumia]|uniref:hypothetical protein n=1 Tax=Mumia TaxID=1546255 RepID=UPI0014238CAA|nr:hypothetical protein [Mumia sp. ZJ430]